MWERVPHGDVDVRWPADLEARVLGALVETLSDPESPGGPVRYYDGHDGRPSEGAAVAERLSPLLGGRPRSFDELFAHLPTPFLLHVGAPHLASAPLYDAIAQVVAAIVKSVGLPTRRIWVDCYVGRYSQTPFGVHYDGASNFTTALVGGKTMHLWEPEDYWRIAPFESSLKLPAHGPMRARLLEAARALPITRGRTSYWPARFWHVAEPCAGPSVTLNVAAYWALPGQQSACPATPDVSSAAVRANYHRHANDPASLLAAFDRDLSPARRAEVFEQLLQLLAPEVAAAAPGIDRMPRTNIARPQTTGAWPLPSEIEQELARFEARATGVRRATQERWLRHCSSLGLGPPPLRSDDLADRTVISAPLGYPLRWHVDEHDRTTTIGVRGRLLRHHDSGPLVKVLEHLNAAMTSVAELSALYGNKDGHGARRGLDVRGLVNRLYRAGGVAALREKAS